MTCPHEEMEYSFCLACELAKREKLVIELQHRLEAAENVLNNLRGHDAETVDEDLMARWRKAAGK